MMTGQQRMLSLSVVVHAGARRAPRVGRTAAEPLAVAPQGGRRPQRPHSAEDRLELERNWHARHHRPGP
jgi:hypothetical protein